MQNKSWLSRLMMLVLVLGCDTRSNLTSFDIGSKKGKEGGGGDNKPVETFSYVRLHPENPRFLQAMPNGRPFIIAGYVNLVPTSRPTNYVADIEKMKAHGQNYTRVWHLIPWEENDAIWPWAKSSTSGAFYGGNKYDLNKWNDEYWTRMKDALKRTTDAGIVAELMIFDKSGISENGGALRWGANPWAADNNVNALEVQGGARSGIPEFYQTDSRPNLRKYQEAYVKKLIDETIDYNIIYEVENEHNDNDPTFAERWGKFVKNYISTKYPKSPRLTSYSSMTPEILEHFQPTSSIDIVNVHPFNATGRFPYGLSSYIEGRWKFNKAVNIDEFGNNDEFPWQTRRAAWAIITSGGHFHIEDAADTAQPFDVIDNVNEFLKVSKWDFVHAAPNRRHSLTGFCMIQEGVEYLCYYVDGGTKKLDVAAGTYVLQWWNPRGKGGYTGTQTVNHPGGRLSVIAPTIDDWVLHLKTTKTGVAPVALKAPPPHPCADLGYDVPNTSQECPRKKMIHSVAVNTAIDRVIEISEIFDAPTHIADKYQDLYHWLVTEELAKLGYCSGFDSEEIGVKNSNTFSEQYDIITAGGNVRRYYASTCSPVQVQEGPNR